MEEFATMPRSMIYERFYAIFCHILSKVRTHPDQEILSKIRQKAKNADGLDESNNLLNFLYYNSCNIEEYFVAMDMDKTYRKEELFHKALSTFSTFQENIDDFNSHASKIYTTREAYPIWSLYAQKHLQYNWDILLSYARIQLVCADPINF
jgi:hypothetical protein